jgi:Rod binding domain-containing protein
MEIMKVDNISNQRPHQNNNQQFVYYKGMKIPKEYLELAQSMETQFIEQMLEQMTQDLSGDEVSAAQNYYKSLQNQERAKIMATSEKNTGITDVVLNQILPAHYKQDLRNIKNNKQVISTYGDIAKKMD